MAIEIEEILEKYIKYVLGKQIAHVENNDRIDCLGKF
jgi:hypothetical protein